jgi:hypothetical protein
MSRSLRVTCQDVCACTHHRVKPHTSADLDVASTPRTRRPRRDRVRPRRGLPRPLLEPPVTGRTLACSSASARHQARVEARPRRGKLTTDLQHDLAVGPAVRTCRWPARSSSAVPLFLESRWGCDNVLAAQRPRISSGASVVPASSRRLCHNRARHTGATPARARRPRRRRPRRHPCWQPPRSLCRSAPTRAPPSLSAGRCWRVPWRFRGRRWHWRGRL